MPTQGKPKGGSAAAKVDSYGTASQRPLHALFFLLPLIVAYELGTTYYLSDPSHGLTETIGAHSFLLRMFGNLGEYGRYIPAALLVTVLLLLHLFRRDPLSVKFRVIVGMFAEAMLWTIPLWVFSLLVPLHPNGIGPPAAAGAGLDLMSLSWQARVTLSTGAGLYEELLFRLVLVTIAHFVIVDILRQSSSTGYVVAVIISALAFAFYHNITLPSGGVHLGLILFYVLAGGYFAVLMVLRGFGIVAMAHAMYDIVVLVIQPALASSGKS